MLNWARKLTLQAHSATLVTFNTAMLSFVQNTTSPAIFSLFCSFSCHWCSNKHSIFQSMEPGLQDSAWIFESRFYHLKGTWKSGAFCMQVLKMPCFHEFLIFPKTAMLMLNQASKLTLQAHSATLVTLNTARLSFVQNTTSLAIFSLFCSFSCHW